MTFNDWLNCLPYDDDFDLDALVHIGEKIGLQLDREETNILVNFLANDLSSASTLEEFK